jgi:hypothetical protein
MDMVIKMEDAGFRNDLIDGAISMLRQEIATLVSHFAYQQPTQVIADYQDNSSWSDFVIA